MFDDGGGPTVLAGSGGEPINYFRWRSNQWQPISDGLPANRRYSYGQIVLDDGDGPALYTCLELLDGTSRSYRFRNGTWAAMPLAFWQWNPIGGLETWWPLASVDFGAGPRIYGNVAYGRVGRWNGTAWDVIGQANSGIELMIGYDDGAGVALYVFGQLDRINGVSTPEFAKWDGQTWTGPWPNGNAGYGGRPAAVVYDDGLGAKLYSNYMFAYNGVNRRGLHRWDGTQWEFMGGPTSGGLNALTVFDDGTGSGPGLYITGGFTNFANLPARSIVRYDGRGFHLVPGSEVWGNPVGIGVIRDERGEGLAMWGGYPPAPDPARVFPTLGVLYGCTLPTCPADCDANGRLDVNDFVCFLTAFAARRPFANAFPDGAFDVQDFAAFLERFAAGCPQ